MGGVYLQCVYVLYKIRVSSIVTRYSSSAKLRRRGCEIVGKTHMEVQGKSIVNLFLNRVNLGVCIDRVKLNL